MLRVLWQTVLDIIYPPTCPVCRREVAVVPMWCDACLATVWRPHLVQATHYRLRHLQRVATVCEYTGGVKTLLHAMKFHGKKRYATALGWLLTREPISLPPWDIAVIVPLHPERERVRGYNQVEEIFRMWLTEQGKPVVAMLKRARSTQPQWRLHVKERRKNIKDAFVVTRPEWVKGHRILLIDDIVTTGITLDECAKVLYKAGAAEVQALTLASSTLEA